jgi:hypothetical protein
MSAIHPVDRLFDLSRRFGVERANDKLELLGNIAALKRLSAKRMILLHDTLYFMRAYPDNSRVLEMVRSQIAGFRERVDTYTGGQEEHHAFLNTGLPATCNTYAYSYAVLQRLVRLNPGCLELDWDEFPDQSPLVDALMITVASSEARGLEDESLSLREWLQECKSSARQTDLEVVLELFRESALDPDHQEHVFETCDLPVAYRLRRPGSGRCEVSLSVDDICCQSKPIPRERFPLRSRIVKRLDHHHELSEPASRKIIDLSLAALCSRNLEIHPLIHANPSDVTLVGCGRGVQVALVGMLPSFRSALECDLFFLILKNGVPIAYGPASIFLGCCEMGINLFPEFRGGEIRYIYAEFMHTLYNLADVRYFFLTSYGMGENNPEALKSGAFWFYRKLGFKASNPDVESVARREEELMRRRPGYRCSMSTLRKLSQTEAYFDLSGGECVPIDFATLGLAASRYIANRFGGNRRRAEGVSTREISRMLRIGDFASWRSDEKTAMTRMAPILRLLPAIDRWPKRVKRDLVSAIKARGGTSELDYIRRVGKIDGLAPALHAAASGAAVGR